MEKSIIVIGGGLSGLSAGCYGRMNGYKTSVFEMHSITGGVATAWKRKGYTIDGAMNWLMGTNKNSSYHRIWRELGAAQNWTIYNHELSAVIENRQGKTFYVYCDADRFERYLLELAPEDEKPIKAITKILRSVSLDAPVGKPAGLNNLFDYLGMMKMLSLGNLYRKWGKVTAKEYAAKFRNPYLREMFTEAFGSQVPLVLSLLALAMQHRKYAGYVIGGAMALVEPIERRYRELGGDLHLNARVEKILVESNRAVGIRLADGSEHRADWVVSTADGRTTIFDMLEGKFTDDEIRNRYEHPKLFEPLVYVALGVNRAFEDVPPSLNGTVFPLDNPIVIGGKERKNLNLRVYNFDPILSPPGKNVAVVAFETEYDYWKKLYEHPEAYKVEKQRVAEDVISGLEQRFPGITAQVEMRDVATPVTWERYTGNWRGAYEGWQFDYNSIFSGMKKTLPGLTNFYMGGQWVNPGGGMPTAAISGNHTIQLICKKDSKHFITSMP